MLDEHEIELYAITLSHSTSAIKNKNLYRDASIFFLKVNLQHYTVARLFTLLLKGGGP